MAKYACPVCGDPTAFPLWIGAAPTGCPYDYTDAFREVLADDSMDDFSGTQLSWADGGRRRINNVSECEYQRSKAWQAAEFRKLVPDAFDATGTIKDGGLGRVLSAFTKAYPGWALR